MPIRKTLILFAVLISLPGFSCTSSTPAPIASENPLCIAQGPILWSPHDTKLTIQAVREHNARWCSVCGRERPDCARLLQSLSQ